MKQTKVHAHFLSVPVQQRTTITTNKRHRGRNNQPIINQQKPNVYEKTDFVHVPVLGHSDTNE